LGFIENSLTPHENLGKLLPAVFRDWRATPPFKRFRVLCGVFSLFLPLLRAHLLFMGKNSPSSQKPYVCGNLGALFEKLGSQTRKILLNNYSRKQNDAFALAHLHLRASAFAGKVNAARVIWRALKKRAAEENSERRSR